MVTQEAPKIYFHYLAKRFYFTRRAQLKHFLRASLKKRGRDIEAINFIFCEDALLLEINRQHLNHDTYTDIITFDLSSHESALLADIYISVERVKENANNFNTTFEEELHRVIFHGVLHLLGFNDKNSKQSKLMREQEQLWLSSYFVSREKSQKH